MIRRITIFALAAATFATGAHAAVRELDQDELRAAVQGGQGLGLGDVLKTVAQQVQGDTVDVRVFDADGLIYNILVMLPNGKMAYVFVDAATGDFVAPNSSRAQDVLAAAKSSKGNNGNSLGAQKSNGNNGKGPGNNNAGGNGKGKAKGRK